MALAVSEPVAEFTSNADASSYTHGSSYTPTANSLQVIFVGATGTVAASPTISGGSGWTTAPALQATKGDWNSSANTVYCFVGLAGASPGSFTPVFDCTGDAATGCTMSFFEITGAATSSYVVQMDGINSVIGANPTFTFGSSLNTNNCYLAAICNTANPATITPPTSWTETVDSGHTSPTTGVWAGYRVNGESGTTITATKASSTHGGLAIEIAVLPSGSYTITAASGSYAITGAAASLKRGYKITGAVGSYAITGTAATLKRAVSIAAAVGSYAITGTAAALKVGYRLPAAVGSYALTGIAAALQKGHTLTAAAGSYAITGTAASLKVGYHLAATAGSYALTGTAASLKTGYRLAGAVGSYLLAGTDATLKRAIALASAVGSYAITGTAASLRKGSRLGADPGSYAITGTDATLTYTPAGSYSISADSGSYALTGIDATLTYTPSVAPVAPGSAASGGDPGDDGQLARFTRRENTPVAENIKQPYLKTLKEFSKEPEPQIEVAKKKRRVFREPQVEYRKPRIRATGTAAPEPSRPALSEPDPLRLQRIQAFADRQREAREAELAKQNLIQAQNELRAQIETERALMAQHLEKLLVEQDDEDAAMAALLLVE